MADFFATKDTFIKTVGGPFGASVVIDAGYSTGKSSFTERGLITFDVSLLGTPYTVGTAYLNLYVKAFPAWVTFRTGRLTHSWTEDYATWSNSDNGVPWSFPGGSYDLTDSVIFSTGGLTTGWWSIDATALVQDAIDNRSSIVDLILRLVTESGDTQILSVSSRTGTNPPYLSVLPPQNGWLVNGKRLSSQFQVLAGGMCE